jgi:glycosyltransferase involved in cell wall biosynthesis
MDEDTIKKVKDRKEYLASLGCEYNESPKLSVIVTSFNQRDNIQNLVHGLRKTRGVDEIIVCEDGSIDGSLEEWDRWLERPNDILLRLNDLHEIRSTDRAIRMTRSDICCIVQDDDDLQHHSWVEEALALFDQDEKLGVLGGMYGYHNFFEDMIVQWSGRKRNRPSAKASNKFSYVEQVNVGPYFIRKKYFDEIGGWDFNLSKPGEMGMGFDHELCYRMWLNGFRVGHYFPYNFKNDEQTGSTYAVAGMDKRSKQMKFMENYIIDKHGDEINKVQEFVKLANGEL